MDYGSSCRQVVCQPLALSSLNDLMSILFDFNRLYSMFIITDLVAGCTESSVDYGTTAVTTLTAGLPSWPADGFCRASCQGCATSCAVSLPYTMSADLMNVQLRSPRSHVQCARHE